MCLCSSGDVDIFADNTKRKSKTTRVKENGTKPLGIATNVVFVHFNPPSCHSTTRKFITKKVWYDPSRTYNMEIGIVEDHLNKNVFRPYRNQKQHDLIGKISKELRDGAGEDHIDLATRCDDRLVCMNCQCINPKTAKTCEKCE